MPAAPAYRDPTPEEIQQHNPRGATGFLGVNPLNGQPVWSSDVLAGAGGPTDAQRQQEMATAAGLAANPLTSSPNPSYLNPYSGDRVPMNPNQFLDPASAGRLATAVGGTASTQQDPNQSAPWTYVNAGGRQQNAGLLADLIRRHGSYRGATQAMGMLSPTAPGAAAPPGGAVTPPGGSTTPPVTRGPGGGPGRTRAAQYLPTDAGGSSGGYDQMTTGALEDPNSPYIRTNPGRQGGAFDRPTLPYDPGYNQPPTYQTGPVDRGGGGYLRPSGTGPNQSTNPVQDPTSPILGGGGGSDTGPPPSGGGMIGDPLGYRYGLPGPRFDMYQGGGTGLFHPTYDLGEMIANNRNLAYYGGQNLQDQFGNMARYQHARSGLYEDAANQAYGDIAGGRGGYLPSEQANILREPQLAGLQQTPEESAANYLQDYERAGIEGDPNEVMRRVGENVNQFESLAGDRQNRVREALGQQEGYLRGTQARYGENVRGALGAGEEAAGKYIDPSYLTLSQDFQNKYQFGPQDEQAIKDQAARTVANRTAAQNEELQRRANAEGNTNPLALQAAINRNRTTGDINAADAQTDAAIRARQMALETARQSEQMRLGAEQQYAGLGANTALTLGGRRVGAEAGLGESGLGTERYLGGARLGGEQDISNALMQGYGRLGEQAVGAQQWTDTAASQRAAQIAANRQAAERYNQGQRYGRGMEQYGALSGGYRDIAGQRLGAEREYRGYLGGQQQQAQQAGQVAGQQQLGAYGTQHQAMGGAAQAGVGQYQGRGLFQRFFAKGGEAIKGPQPVIVGEAGPEIIIDLKRYLPHAGEGATPEEYGDYGDTGTTATSGDTVRVSKKHDDPMWKKLLESGYGVAQGASQGASQGGDGGAGQFLGSVITAIAGLLGEGGVVAPAMKHGGMRIPEARIPSANIPSARYLGNGMTYVNGPQVRVLGRTPEAVVPLTHRREAKVGFSDLPYLKAKYGMEAAGDGGMWIQGAIKHPGALTRSAHEAGMSPMAFAREHQGDSGVTGKRARLAMTLSKMHGG